MKSMLGALPRVALSSGVVLAALLLSSCSTHGAAAAPSTPPNTPPEPPRPRGVLPTLPAVAPPIVKQTSGDEGPVALREPRARTAAIPLVRRFLSGVFTGHLDELKTLLHDGASAQPYDKKSTVRLLQLWTNRINQTFVGDLGPALPIDESSLRCYGPEQLPINAPIINNAGKDMLLVYVRVSPSHVSGKRVLPDEMWFALTPFGSSYRIAKVIERVNH